MSRIYFIAAVLGGVSVLLGGCSKPLLDASQQAEVERAVTLVAEATRRYGGAKPDFAAIEDVAQKKQRFFDYLRPAIQAVNAVIRADRVKLQSLIETTSASQPLSFRQQQWLDKLVAVYGLTPEMPRSELLAELRRRVDVIPAALALVQAANESAWGTSRFAIEGNNYFGQWCYRSGCGLVPAARETGASHEVAAFTTPYESVSAYFSNINTHAAYRRLREIRRELRRQGKPLTAVALAAGLTAYSQRGEAYVEEITDMIRHNREYLEG